ncbi:MULTISPECIES: Crp/Fnr family transcriptional regulator [unclassified Mesobacillus]|uniref:Crp/Fnr family transcriptional regulator n=1 Tax=unclassified Mesobacillus TaxID=2675270 RepID=UPI00203A5123|nr:MULTISPECIES: Crp/Fnr family transcriptional regulator [unclassified Mesobacillus]MCM3124880.1 Crp/Fnr family transcriptional regulator [Mesobacillus sp. MER 33]MCM3232811.1 Crp/Fnr family transcriptional regulator [Mesobacillus sp. MER 48]
MLTAATLSPNMNKLFEKVHRIKNIDKGSFLFEEGNTANELYIIQSGKFQVSKMIPDGRELTIRMCSAGELVGELTLFSPESQHILNVRASESGSVAVIQKDRLEDEIAKDSGLALELVKWLSLQHRKSQTRFRDLVLHGKKGALYSTLIRLVNSFGVKTEDGMKIDVSLTNQELANFCGTSREVVNRLLSELRKQDIISIDKGYITIHALHRLKREIDCENCPIEICNIE